MLSPAEVVQAAERAAPDASVRDLTEQRQVPLPLEPLRGERHGWEDLPKIEAAFGDVVTTFTLDKLGHPWRWQAVVRDGQATVAHQVVRGAGDVHRVLSEARQLAGLPEPPGTVHPTSLGQTT